MKKTISALTIAAASCLLLGSTAQAATVIERRVTTEPALQPEIVTERTVTRTEVVEPGIRGRVVSGATLSGRREIISDDALIIPRGTGRAIIRDDRGTRNVRVRGWLNPGAGSFQAMDDDDNELEDRDDLDD